MIYNTKDVSFLTSSIKSLSSAGISSLDEVIVGAFSIK